MFQYSDGLGFRGLRFIFLRVGDSGLWAWGLEFTFICLPLGVSGLGIYGLSYSLPEEYVEELSLLCPRGSLIYTGLGFRV